MGTDIVDRGYYSVFCYFSVFFPFPPLEIFLPTPLPSFIDKMHLTTNACINELMHLYRPLQMQILQSLFVVMNEVDLCYYRYM